MGVEEGYSSAEIQSVYSTAPADWATEHLFGGGGSPTSLQGFSRCILLPKLTGAQDIRWRGKSYPSAEIQSVYSTAPADWFPRG